MKTDMYTKIVLTVIAVALVGILVKDIDIVSKAQASPANIDLSALNIEKAESSDENEMTFFIYENSKIKRPFSNNEPYEGVCWISSKDIPSHIITNIKTPSPYHIGSDYIEIKKRK